MTDVDAEVTPEEATNDEVETIENFVPHPNSFEPLAFLKADNADIEAKTVDCGNCPVAIYCLAGENGTGFVCKQCGGTATFAISSKETGRLYIIDCAKHQFKTETELPKCPLCNGALIRFELAKATPINHIIRTKYSKISLADRKKDFTTTYNKFKAAYRSE